jgi:N-acetylneuraminic acid mutarotase
MSVDRSNGECALAISTWDVPFESGYELIDPAIGLGDPPSDSGLSAGAIAGISLGTIFVAGGAAFIGKREYDKRSELEDADLTSRLV